MKSLTVTPFIRDSFENYQKSACGITLDIGRQRINRKELLSLIDFVKEQVRRTILIKNLNNICENF